VTCQLCGSTQTRKLFETRDLNKTAGGIFSLLECQECGIVFISPLPSKKTSISFYPDSYYTHFPVREKAIIKKARKYTCTWRARILQERYGYPFGLSGTGGFCRKLPRFFCNWKDILPFTGTGHILDIGCGNGETLYFLKQLGWDVRGVDPDAKACAAAKIAGIPAFCGDVIEARYPDAFFDVVRINHVMEHISNPREIFKEIKRITKPGGEVIITVPNIESIGFRLFGKMWFGLDIPRHIYHYSPESLGHLAAECGFSKVKVIHQKGHGMLVKSMVSRVKTMGKVGETIVRKNLAFRACLLFIACLGEALRKGESFTMILVNTKPVVSNKNLVI